MKLRLAFLLSAAACAAEAPFAPFAPREERIVHGTRGPQNVALTDGEQLAVVFLADRAGDEFCTGTLSTPRLVVTARHCVEWASAGDVLVGFGVEPASAEALLEVAAIRRHPSIDFALLVLDADALLEVPGVEPIAVNREPVGAGWVGRWVDAAGYGATYSSATGRFFASVELVDFDLETVTVDGHGAQGICYGDSGGPILWQADPTAAPVVVGTEQWGDSSCVDRDYLTRLDAVVDWLDRVVSAGLPPIPGACDSCPGCVDCDGACADLASDPAHCGGCDIACAVPNGTPACVTGSCAVLTCDAGFVDQDRDPDNGCEGAAPPDGKRRGGCNAAPAGAGALLFALARLLLRRHIAGLTRPAWI